MPLAWGAKVSPLFRSLVIGTARRLSIPDPSWLMACMAFETGESFSPSIRNAAGSGAVGLIQFMPQTAAKEGTSVEKLAAMSAESQLQVVESYFKPWAGKLHSLGDVYGAILWPGMIGQPDTAVIFDKADPSHPKQYLQNKGLDTNADGKITKAEIVARVQAKLVRGLQPPFVFADQPLSA
jgi:hypothetical protein